MGGMNDDARRRNEICLKILQNKTRLKSDYHADQKCYKIWPRLAFGTDAKALKNADRVVQLRIHIEMPNSVYKPDKPENLENLQKPIIRPDLALFRY